MILDAVEEWHKGWATDHTLDGTIDLNVLMHVLNVTSVATPRSVISSS